MVKEGILAPSLPNPLGRPRKGVSREVRLQLCGKVSAQLAGPHPFGQLHNHRGAVLRLRGKVPPKFLGQVSLELLSFLPQGGIHSNAAGRGKENLQRTEDKSLLRTRRELRKLWKFPHDAQLSGAGKSAAGGTGPGYLLCSPKPRNKVQTLLRS